MKVSRIIVLFLLFYYYNAVCGFIGGSDLIITLHNRYRNQKTFTAIQEEYLLSSKYPRLIHGMMPVRLPVGMSRETASEILAGDSRIAHVEPDRIVYCTSLPNDPFFNLQWSLYAPENDRIDIKAVEAWRFHTGSKKIVIAILDTGLNYKHPDLAQNVWTNTGEIPGNNQDDDNNGFVDDVYGWDFAYDDNDPMDGYFHGTHVAGIIGAVTNNATGIAGIMHHVSLMGVKGITDYGWGFSSDLIAGIYYAVDNGAHIINASWGGGGYLEAMIEALNYAAQHNVIFVAAAGNYRWDNDETPFYPASYPGDNIVSVGASDHQDSIAVFSHYGRHSVDLFAPGVLVLSTGLGSSYLYGTGTSMAAPHVAGSLGLLRAADPSMRYTDYIDILLENVAHKSHLEDYCVSGGRLDVHKALRCVARTFAGGYMPVDFKQKAVVLTHILNIVDRKEEE